MPQGIYFDESGNMSAVEVSSESSETDLMNLIHCRELSGLHLTPELMLWVDAEGEDIHEVTPNLALTRLAANYEGFDYPLYGTAVITSWTPGATVSPVSAITEDVSDDNRLQLLTLRIRSERELIRN